MDGFKNQLIIKQTIKNICVKEEKKNDVEQFHLINIIIKIILKI